jgi:RNA polymerase sigma factor (sigma-70 family)
MNGESGINEQRGISARAAFPEKANPFRPVAAASARRREARGDRRPFPRRCDPAARRQPMTEEQRQLTRRFMPMAEHLARRMSRRLRLDFNELRAEAYAALVDAARLFDPEHGANFSVYARPRILGALWKYREFTLLDHHRVEAMERPLFMGLRRSDDFTGWVIGKRPDPLPGQEIDSIDAVESLVRRLPRTQAIACRSIYIEGKSSDEAAEAQGYSKGYLSRLHGNAISTLRRDHREALAG